MLSIVFVWKTGILTSFVVYVWVCLSGCDFSFSVGWRGYLSFLFSFFCLFVSSSILFGVLFPKTKCLNWCLFFQNKKLIFRRRRSFLGCHSKITQFVDHRFFVVVVGRNAMLLIYIFSLLNCMCVCTTNDFFSTGYQKIILKNPTEKKKHIKKRMFSKAREDGFWRGKNTANV